MAPDSPAAAAAPRRAAGRFMGLAVGIVVHGAGGGGGGGAGGGPEGSGLQLDVCREERAAWALQPGKRKGCVGHEP